MKKLSSFLYSVLGGVCIGIGGVVFLSCENKVTGALMFCLGLFTICRVVICTVRGAQIPKG